MRQNLATSEEEISGKGPFFVYSISANAPDERFADLLIYPPIPMPPDGVDSTLLREIAATMQVERLERGEES